MELNKIILDLCGGTGSWSKPYEYAGYKVIVITLPKWDITNHSFEYYFGQKNLIFFTRNGEEEILSIPVKDIAGILAAPPCTMFSLARTKAIKPRDLKVGMECVRACLDIIWSCRETKKLNFWALENPMGYLRQFLGKPALSFDASEFGEDYNKATDLWGYFKPIKTFKKYTRYPSTDKNTRKLPVIPKEYKRDKNMTLTAIKRSITPQGFAKAFFKANN